MSEKPKPPGDEVQDQPVRPYMVTTAANFLLNPSVIDKPDEHKTAFLRKKGLTDAEISLAYEKAEKESKYKQFQNSNISSNPAILPPPIPIYHRPLSFWSRLSKFSSSLIVLGVAVFGAHYVYKNYIEPLLFGEDRNDKSRRLEKQLLGMMKSLSKLEKHVSDLEESISHQKAQLDRFLQNEVSDYYPTPLALRELKAEIISVKSLFLNRHQFPALPKVTPPSIPFWQLPSKETENDTTKQIDESSLVQHVDESNLVTNSPDDINSDNKHSTEYVNGISETIENLEVQHKNSAEIKDILPAP